MKKNNKKAFTLIELVLVIAIIIFLFSIANHFLGQGTASRIEKQIVKDSLVSTLNKIEGYSYTNKTVSQELLNSDGTVNSGISRLNNQRASIDHLDSKVAYYHGLYMTTNSLDSIDNSLSFGRNGFLYLLQYKQEGYLSISPRVLANINVNPETSTQLLKSGGLKWAERYDFPLSSSLYLNKIINPDEDCKLDVSKVSNAIVLYSTASLSFKFYKDGIEDPDFDYKFCFSKDPTRTEDGILSFRINRNFLLENGESSFRH